VTTQPPDIEALLHRLERLELQNKRFTILGLTSLVLLSVALLLTQASCFTGVIEAQIIRLTDDHGMPLIYLGSDSDGTGLSITDSSGKARAILAVSGRGPRLEFRDSVGSTSYQIP